ncbi:MAG: hypothetical protein ACREC0_02430 [Methylocella sp.]
MRRDRKRMLVAAMVLMGAMTTAAVGQGEEACQGDAMRLCSPAIPDHAKIHACLVHYKAYLSPACRAIVAPMKRRRHYSAS